MNKNSENLEQPKVLIVDDIAANLKMLRDILKPHGYRILGASNGNAALKSAEGMQPDIILLDIMMPGIDGYEVCRQLKQNPATKEIPVIFVTAKDDDEDVIQGFRLGGADYISRPIHDEILLLRVKTHLENARLMKSLVAKNRELEEEIARHNQTKQERQQAEDRLSAISQQEAQRWGIDAFVGKSKTIIKILEDVRKAQRAGATSVLITGESGTGKELIARAIHFGGQRAKEPFIPVNCSAIPTELAESALFGHTRGAFTGADKPRKGYFELADGGTLFLDEIGDMPMELQPKLLRVIEDGCITPVGGGSEKRVDVRILAATNADLTQRIAEGRFREDLYHRLARFFVQVPPLRERKEDIPLLIEHFLSMFATEMGITPPALSPEAMMALEAYHFPGNVRELKNIIEHALILSGSSEIKLEHLHFMPFASSAMINRSVSFVPTVEKSSPPLWREQLAKSEATRNQTDFDTLRTQGLDTPSTLDPTSKPQSNGFDNVQKFIDEYCEIAPDAEIHKPELLEQYRHFCHKNRYKPMSRNRFYDQVLQLYPQVFATLIGKERLAGLKGLRMKKL